MTSRNHRKPRASFLPVIARIVARLESLQPSVHLHWTWPAILGGGDDESIIAFESLHVFGSFARGAPLCGDLDIIVAYALPEGGRLPPDRRIRALAVGRAINTDPVIAHPNELPYYLERFPEARMLWSTADRDWRAKVDAIQVVDEAGRFARKIDRLPLSPKQLAYHPLEYLEAVVDSIEAQELTSIWVPREAIVPRPSEWDPELQRLSAFYAESFGRRTREVLPYVLEWISGRMDSIVRARSGRDRASLHFSEFYAHIGRPSIDVELLDRADVAAMILAPHRTTRGPSGLWVLERGPKHEAVSAFAPLSTWMEATGGQPLISGYWSEHSVLPDYVVELFANEHSALDSIPEVDDDGEEFVREVRNVSGSELLNLIAKLEFVLVGGQQLRVSFQKAAAMAAQFGRSLADPSDGCTGENKQEVNVTALKSSSIHTHVK